jgi:hypothetical protein
MVWHAFTLNPRIYLEDCVRYTKHALWRTPFPWQLIYESIDDETFQYSQTDPWEFKKKTGHLWDPIYEDDTKMIICPKCSLAILVPWTRPPPAYGPEALEIYLTHDTGFAGQAFQISCSHCNLLITHEKLRVGKFIDDARDVLYSQRPLAGTILNIWGEPAGTTTGKKIGTHDAFFPNRVIEKCSKFWPESLRSNMDTLTIEGIKNQFQSTMRASLEVDRINSEQSKTHFIAKGSKIAVRKVLSHYWNNSSVFGIDLVGAVLRQGSFVQKVRKSRTMKNDMTY